MGVCDTHEVLGHGGCIPPKIQTFCCTEEGNSKGPRDTGEKGSPCCHTEDTSPPGPESLHLGHPLAAKHRTRCFVKLPPWEVYDSIGDKIKIQTTNKGNEYFS